MARLLPLIALLGSFVCVCLRADRAQEAIAAYQGLQKRITVVRGQLAGDPDPKATLTALNIERDAIDARFPYHPKEPPTLTAERRRADVEMRGLTRRAQSSKPKVKRK